jgi:2-dehydropantoate 2-reductase
MVQDVLLVGYGAVVPFVSAGFLFILTKAVPEILPTSELLAPLLTKAYTDNYEQPIYVIMQNGLGVEVDLYNAIKAIGKPEVPKIISTAVYIGTNQKAGNLVAHEHHVRFYISQLAHIDKKMFPKG